MRGISGIWNFSGRSNLDLFWIAEWMADALVHRTRMGMASLLARMLACVIPQTLVPRFVGQSHAYRGGSIGESSVAK